jgi:hypothetical protein
MYSFLWHALTLGSIPWEQPALTGLQTSKYVSPWARVACAHTITHTPAHPHAHSHTRPLTHPPSHTQPHPPHPHTHTLALTHPHTPSHPHPHTHPTRSLRDRCQNEGNYAKFHNLNCFHEIFERNLGLRSTM